MTSEIYILLNCQALSGEMGGEEHLCCHGDFRMHMDTYVIKYLHQNSVIYETARQWCWKKEGRDIYYVGYKMSLVLLYTTGRLMTPCITLEHINK